MNEPKCPKCKSRMVKGFIGDKENSGQQTRQNWGTGIHALGAGLDNALPITTYRCEKCGYLESYAL